MDKESLEGYRKKRDFGRTPEPSGKEPQKPGEKPIFVIQKHLASTLHYDFRLQVGEVLVSWAVPKGPSTNPQEKRLAVHTEDHPLDYADFEGVIPEGQYGAGKVIVWDTGTYRKLEGKGGQDKPLEKALEEGHIKVWLEGKKLTGGYAFTRTGKGNQWLLVKMRDEQADARRKPVETEPESVLSGQRVEDIGG